MLVTTNAEFYLAHWWYMAARPEIPGVSGFDDICPGAVNKCEHFTAFLFGNLKIIQRCVEMADECIPVTG